MKIRAPQAGTKWRRTPRGREWNPCSGTSLTEMVVTLSIISMLAAGTGLNLLGNRDALQQDRVVTGLLTGIRQCRQEAVTRNLPVQWWITNGYLARWCDANSDGEQEAEEVETLLLDERAAYSSYPRRGCFDSRGIHSTNQSTFNGMMVWIRIEQATYLVTVSANGYADRYQY